MNKLGLYFAAVMAFASVAGAAESRVPYSEREPFGASVGSPVVAEDGRSLYVSLSGAGANAKDGRLARLNLQGRELDTVLSRAPGALSPDGRYGARMGVLDKTYGIVLTSLESGEERLLVGVSQSDHFLGHTADRNFVWSSDGASIAYCASAPEPEDSDASDVIVIDRLLFKTRTSFTDNRVTDVFVVDVESGEARQVTDDPYDNHSLSWRPGSREVAFISNRTEDPDDNHNNDMWKVNVDTGIVTRLTDTPGTEFDPHWSPDGASLAYFGGIRPMNTRDSQAENAGLWVLGADGGVPVRLAAALDRRMRNIQWGPGSEHVYMLADDHGTRALYRANRETGAVSKVAGDAGYITSYAVADKARRIVYRRAAFDDPGELWTCSLSGRNARQITEYQDAFKEHVAISVPETLWFDSYDGQRVQGWLMRPTSFEEGRTYPLILSIHGGPHGAYGQYLSGTNQAYAEAGYGVLYINPRGSTGYGQAFVDGTIENWGGGDYRDLMAGLDYAMAHHSWIDGERLGVIGGSYGGYMTNWVVTQTDRFAAAVSIASLSNLVSFYGTSLYHLLMETEFPGELWENYDLLWHWSPLAHIERATTPTLLIHGADDHDVPITQAEEMFVALKKRGVETVLVRYPDEGHGIRQTAHAEDMRARIADWFGKYLNP